jgi:hypothetical protein
MYTICIWQQPLHHSDNTRSTRQATGTDHHCLGTCPNAAQVSLYPPQRTRVAGWNTVPLPHEPPHWNWTACPSESSSMAQTRDSHTGRDRGCKVADPEHPSQNGAGCPVLRGQHVGVRYRGALAHPGTVFRAVCFWLLALLPHVSMFHLNNPYSTLHSHRCENFKSNKINIICSYVWVRWQ